MADIGSEKRICIYVCMYVCMYVRRSWRSKGHHPSKLFDITQNMVTDTDGILTWELLNIAA
jgi:hypothetical protein